MLELRDRIAIVTGGGSGIGAACMRLLAERGARPVAGDITGGDIVCDVSAEPAVKAALDETIARYGAPSLLVAAAGVSNAGAIPDLSIEDWDRTFAVNARGVMICMKILSGAMIAHRLDGSMVLVSSINGHVADPGLIAYSATKAALHHMSRVAARELGPFGIRINCVGPGPTATPMLQPMLDIPEYNAEIIRRTPLRDVGTPERIAEAIVGLMQMEWVTGQSLLVDGGASLSTARTAWQAPNINASPATPSAPRQLAGEA
jgi:NAD(P)-dependent dehydrogenase (short-subunit alcohol dehydrogenase family)